MPRQRHVAKVAQSATATWQKPCHFNVLVGPETFFKQFFFYRDVFQALFFRDENQNWLKLQGRKSYLSYIYIYMCVCVCVCVLFVLQFWWCKWSIIFSGEISCLLYKHCNSFGLIFSFLVPRLDFITTFCF